MKQVFISTKAGKPLVRFLAKQGYEINTVTEYGIVNKHTQDINHALGLEYDNQGQILPTRQIHVDPRIATHPDIYMCQLGLWNEAGIFFGDPEKLHPIYPNDIIYNAVCTKNYVLHLVEKTDRELLDSIVTWRRGLATSDSKSTASPTSNSHSETKIIDVRQGYTRCMCLPVDDDSFIVSDEALAKPLEAHGAKVLQVEPGHIKLEGFKYGFIGGCAGNIYINSPEVMEQRAIVFNGDLSVHPNFVKITDFIKSRNILPVLFEDYALEDIGSILAME